MASQGGTSYTAVPRRNSDGRMFLDDIPLATRFQSHPDHEHKTARQSISDEDEPDPRATKAAFYGHAVPLTGEHEGKGTLNGVQPVQWRISLYTPIAMVSLFISGLLVAIGHHLFYSRFNGTRVRGPKEDGASEYISQVWIIRYGTAFAFVAKTLLAGAIVVAYKQHMWINLRHKANSVSTIDAVFAATHDFLAFLSPAFWAKAKIPALLALIAWCLPLAALVTPSTLTVIGDARNTTSPTLVPALNLKDQNLYETGGVSEGTSPLLHRTTLATAMSMQILPMRRILPINASYEYEFEGPSLKCEKATGDRLQSMKAVEKETIKQLMEASDHNSLEADIRYLSFVGNKTGISTTGTDNITTYVTECIAGESFRDCIAQSNEPTLFIRMGNESITCTTYNTHFKALFGALGALDTQPISNVRHEWKEPLNTRVTKAILKALSFILNGFFGTYTGGSKGGGLFSGKTMIADTALLELLQQSFPSLRNTVPQEAWMATISTKSLAETIEELSRNQTMSLFSTEALWLPDENNTTMANVTYWDVHNKYEYLPQNLWLAYGFAIACSFTAVLLGLRALWLNGVSHDNSFSAIMAVTRNKYLDRLTWGHSLGATPMGEEILKARLKFGVLEGSDVGESNGLRRAGFGTDDTVGRLRKRQVVY